MSVELRIVNNRLECDWGTIEHSTPRKIAGKPCHVEVGHLMLAASEFIKELLTTGEPTYCNDCITTATAQDGRVFMHAEAENGRWTWELFESHWWDGKGPDLLIGRWPD